jgi:hypothetical protein
MLQLRDGRDQLDETTDGCLSRRTSDTGAGGGAGDDAVSRARSRWPISSRSPQPRLAIGVGERDPDAIFATLAGRWNASASEVDAAQPWRALATVDLPTPETPVTTTMLTASRRRGADELPEHRDPVGASWSLAGGVEPLQHRNRGQRPEAFASNDLRIDPAGLEERLPRRLPPTDGDSRRSTGTTRRPQRPGPRSPFEIDEADQPPVTDDR